MFNSGRFLRRAARAAEGGPYQSLANDHIPHTTLLLNRHTLPAPAALTVTGLKRAIVYCTRPASEESHTESPTTAKKCSFSLSVAPQSRSVLVVQPPPGGCTTTRASSVRTSAGGQASGRARRQLDSARREVTKASLSRAVSRDYHSTPMDLEHGISALDQMPRRRAAHGPTSGRRSRFFSGRFVRRSRELTKDDLII